MLSCTLSFVRCFLLGDVSAGAAEKRGRSWSFWVAASTGYPVLAPKASSPAAEVLKPPEPSSARAEPEV